MAYASISFVYGETPSASKWNILGTNDASFNDGTGIAGLYKNLLATDSNPYKFRAYRTSAYNFVGTTFTKVPFDTESFDTNSNFATGTYTAPVNGFYQFNGSVRTSQGSGAHRVLSALFKNGSEIARGSDISGGFFNGSNVSDLVQLSAGDTIELYYYADTTLAMDVTSAVSCNYLSGHLVSRT